MKEIGLKISKMGLEHIFGWKIKERVSISVIDTKENGWMDWDMDVVCFILQMGQGMMVNGKTISNMDLPFLWMKKGK